MARFCKSNVLTELTRRSRMNRTEYDPATITRPMNTGAVEGCGWLLDTIRNTSGFNKAFFLAACSDRMDELDRAHKFDRHNGTAQCVGKSANFARAYGEWRELERLIQDTVGGYFP